MSPTKRASGVPGLRAAIQAAPPIPPAAPVTADAPSDPAPASPRAAEAPPRPAGRPPRPPKPVRYTLDLAPDDHLFLRRFAVDAGVNASAVVRALLARLRDDPELAAGVRSDVWASG